jgi:hypothetical protein
MACTGKRLRCAHINSDDGFEFCLMPAHQKLQNIGTRNSATTKNSSNNGNPSFQ